MTVADPDQDRSDRSTDTSPDTVAGDLVGVVWLMIRRSVQVVRSVAAERWRHLVATSPRWFVVLFACWLAVAAVLWVALLVWVFLL